jgi:hypothetical protein
MPLVRSTFLLSEDSFPAFVACLLDLLLFCVAGNKCPLDRYLRSVVAIEESSVDFDAGNSSRCNPKTYDDPVCGLCVVTSSFPSVVPSAGVGKDARFADGRCGCDEIGGTGKPLVTEGENG